MWSLQAHSLSKFWQRMDSRVTRLVYEKVAQTVAQPIFLLNRYTTFTGDKSWPKIGATFVNYENLLTYSKQSPIGRKFAQSGHPDGQ
jgi:hypothetical protein